MLRQKFKGAKLKNMYNNENIMIDKLKSHWFCFVKRTKYINLAPDKALDLKRQYNKFISITIIL